MSGIEIVAALLGLACVALGVRRSLLTYPFGIGAVALLGAVFFDARLYSDAGLQLFFVAANLYGWREWRRSIGRTGAVVVGAMTMRLASVRLPISSGWNNRGPLIGNALLKVSRPYASAEEWCRAAAAKEMVGERGFEPPAPASRRQCSTRLSYSPTESRVIGLFGGLPVLGGAPIASTLRAGKRSRTESVRDRRIVSCWAPASC